MEKQQPAPNETQKFKIGQEFFITHYPTNKVMKMKIKGRKENRIIFSLDDGEEKEYRVNKVSYPPSESLLIDDYSAVFSYNYIGRKPFKE